MEMIAVGISKKALPLGKMMFKLRLYKLREAGT